jgi:hypothetical protein
MAHVRSAHALPRIEKFVELFENASSERDTIGVPLDPNFIASCVDPNAKRSFDQPKRLFAVSVEGSGRRVVVEGQALVSRCIFSSQ